MSKNVQNYVSKVLEGDVIKVDVSVEHVVVQQAVRDAKDVAETKSNNKE
jgi:hypothetical protein